MPTPVQPLDPPVPPASDTAPRGSKKRSRASRRAQTTVLTTDTSNFRAMVQQFTGIPSPPFDLAAFSPLARSRFSLFRPPSPSSFASSSSPFLLRPFPLKPQISTLTPNPTIATTPATDSTSVATPSVYSTTIADLNPSAQIPPIDRNQSASADAGELIGRRSLQSLLDEIPVFFSGSTEPVKPGSSGLELGSCKLNFLTPGSSGFSAEKGLPAASTQGGEEDATDSWINFSSD